MEKIECFKIQLFKSKSLFDKNECKSIKIINNSKIGLVNPIHIVADPFLFVDNDTLYLFYEQKRLYDGGVIVMTSTKDLTSWTKPKVVLKEDFHLSFPWVFKYENKIYMIPETNEANSIRLYEANEDLTKFKFIKTIISEDKPEGTVSFVDTSIINNEGKYYLFTSVNRDDTNIQRLFVSDEIFGEYKECKCSPICISNKYGRNGGSVFKLNNKIYRISQDCEIRYGDNVNIHEVIKLSDDNYKENLAYTNVLPKTNFYKEGGHHINFVKFKGLYIISTDTKEYKDYLCHKLSKKEIRG